MRVEREGWCFGPRGTVKDRGHRCGEKGECGRSTLGYRYVAGRDALESLGGVLRGRERMRAVDWYLGDADAWMMMCNERWRLTGLRAALR